PLALHALDGTVPPASSARFVPVASRLPEPSLTLERKSEVTTMALLTADDVLNKKFQPTKFREGYDQDEVDDFLDEVVNTLRAVYTENEELKARLAAGGDQAQPAPVESAAQPWQPSAQSASAGEPSAAAVEDTGPAP